MDETAAKTEEPVVGPNDPENPNGTEEENTPKKSILQKKDKIIVQPILGWTQEDIDEFQHIWNNMVQNHSGGLKGIGVNITMWLIEHLHNIKKYFKSFDVNGKTNIIESDETFINHAQHLAFKLDKMIKDLNSPKLGEAFVEHARSHLNRGIRVQNFEQFRDRFYLLIFDLTNTGRKDRPSVMWYQFMNGLIAVYREEQEIYLKAQKWKNLRRNFCCCK